MVFLTWKNREKCRPNLKVSRVFKFIKKAVLSGKKAFGEKSGLSEPETKTKKSSNDSKNSEKKIVLLFYLKMHKV